MSRLRVLVFMGGFSTEHDVSVVSGIGVVRGMDPSKYNIHPVLIEKDGTWIWSSREISPYQKENFSEMYFRSLEGPSAHRKKAPALSELPDVDIAFLALHGKWGEDGHVQALLEHWKIPYTGCGLLASALAMDKIKSKQIYTSASILTPAYKVLSRDSFNGEALSCVANELNFPLVIKDPLGGSSIGVGIAKNMDEALAICEDLFCSSESLLFEQFISGREASCGFMEGEEPFPPTEMQMTTREYFDFEAKYNGECREVTPAPFEQDLTKKIQSVVENAHKALGCSVYSRTDVRIDDKGNVWAIETNTLPGMTPTSLLPQQAECNGVSYTMLIDKIIEKSIKVKR